MDNRRIFGILLLVLGVALLAIGMDATQTISSSLSQPFHRASSEKAVWPIIAGGILGVMGLLVTTRRRLAN